MSDEVSQFLESVERLRGQQIEEDEVRARELEEYLAAKRERQARREGKQSSSELVALLHLLHFRFTWRCRGGHVGQQIHLPLRLPKFAPASLAHTKQKSPWEVI